MILPRAWTLVRQKFFVHLAEQNLEEFDFSRKYFIDKSQNARKIAVREIRFQALVMYIALTCSLVHVEFCDLIVCWERPRSDFFSSSFEWFLLKLVDNIQSHLILDNLIDKRSESNERTLKPTTQAKNSIKFLKERNSGHVFKVVDEFTKQGWHLDSVL